MLLLLMMVHMGGGEVVLPSTDVYHPLTRKTVARRDDGAFFVFDRFDHRILLFEPDRLQGRRIARKGPGPGELEKTNAILIFRDRLYVLSANHVQVFDLTGQFQRRIRLPPGMTIQKTARGWLGRKWGEQLNQIRLTLFDEDLKNPQLLVEWTEDDPGVHRITPGKTFVVPLFSERGNQVVSKDGARLYYRLPHASTIHIYSVAEQNIIGTIPLEGRFPFDITLGEKERERLQKNLPGTVVKAKYPDYFPIAGALDWDPQGYLLVLRRMGRKEALLRFHPDGRPTTPSPLNLEQIKRIVGIQDNDCYISFQNSEKGDMGISRVPREKVFTFFQNNPID